jgi:hypothetical protein
MADLDTLNVIARQYRASLAMLGQAIEFCPESLWFSTDYPNRYWHIAFHAVFYTHLYLHPSEAEFRPWAKCVKDSQFLAPLPWAPQETHIVEPPYTKADVLEYHALCCADVEALVPALDLAAPSGFHWLPFNKLELQFYNLRHVQHHIGQLAGRLRIAAGIGLAWVGRVNRPV